MDPIYELKVTLPDSKQDVKARGPLRVVTAAAVAFLQFSPYGMLSLTIDKVTE